MTTVTNYDGTVISTPQRLVRARRVAEIQAILRDREQFPSPVRAMGSFHSLTACAASSGTMVSMSGLNQIIQIDRESMTMTAEAGLQLVDAAAALRALDLQLVLNHEIGNMTLGSAACCHSKDSLDGVELGQSSSYVTAIKWVTPSGELVEASEERDPELLSKVRSSYGLCGIVHEVTVRIKPVETVRFDYAIHDVRDLRQTMVSDAIDANQGVVFWTIGQKVVIQTRNRAARLRNAWVAGARRRFWARIGASMARSSGVVRGTALQQGVDRLWPVVQELPYRFLSAIGGFSLHDPDKMIDYRRTPPFGRFTFSFWAFPREAWVENLRAYLDFSDRHLRRTGFRCNMPLGSYFIRHDRSSLLSYSHDGDIISIDPIHAPSTQDRAAWERFLHELNDWAHERRGIPLFNQSPFLTRAQVLAAYGSRWEQFCRWIAEVDPEKRMLNAFFAELLV